MWNCIRRQLQHIQALEETIEKCPDRVNCLGVMDSETELPVFWLENVRKGGVVIFEEKKKTFILP